MPVSKLRVIKRRGTMWEKTEIFSLTCCCDER